MTRPPKAQRKGTLYLTVSLVNWRWKGNALVVKHDRKALDPKRWWWWKITRRPGAIEFGGEYVIPKRFAQWILKKQGQDPTWPKPYTLEGWKDE